MATITPTLTIAANASSATTPGPVSTPISISATAALTVVTVKAATTLVPTAAAALFTDTLQTEGDEAGTHGAFIYMKNVSPGDHDIYIGFEVTDATAAEIQGDGAATRVGTLKQGEFAFFPYDFAGDIMIDSQDAAAKLEYFFFSRT
tara:strand:- start:230 stop:670 length:441 start_codon:yes stop_codon:yes gene_type:complete